MSRIGEGPSFPTKQAHSRNELNQMEQSGALDDNIAPASNSELLSPTKHAMAGANTPTFFGRLLGGFRLSSKQTDSEERLNLQTVVDGEQSEENQTVPGPASLESPSPEPKPSIPRAQTPTAKTTALKSPTLKKRKLGPSRPRADSYEVEEDEEPQNTRKRPRQQAKAPLAIPKTTNGYAASPNTRQIRVNSALRHEEVEEVGARVDMVASGPGDGYQAGVIVGGNQAQPAVKRGRGRPQKINKDITTPKKATTNHAAENALVAPTLLDLGLQAPEETEEGMSDVLINPSPKKAIRQEIQPAAVTSEPNNRSQGKKKGFEVLNGNMLVSDSDDDDNDREAEGEDENPVEDEEIYDAVEIGPCPIDQDLIDRIVENAGHIGLKYDRVTDSWSGRKRKEQLWTEPGKKMDRQLKGLKKSYIALEAFKVARKTRAFRLEHTKVEEEIARLVAEVESLLEASFAEDADPGKAREILKDLCFNTIPQLILALQEAVKVHDIEGSMTTPSLQEISALVKALRDLVSTVRKQPTDKRPKISAGQVMKPILSNRLLIRNLETAITRELETRKRAKKRIDGELQRPERETKHQKREERAEAEKNRMREETLKMQGKSWRNFQARFPSPLWQRMYSAEIARLEARSSSQAQQAAARKGEGRQESVESGYDRMQSFESSQGSDSGVERISMFPGNNVNDRGGLKSLSDEDKNAFIECMRDEQGDDRYEKAAELIGRSMDDVFAFAKEFQEAMDAEHEIGNFNEPRDDWTYNVWTEQQ